MYLKDLASCFLPPNLALAKEVGESARGAGNFGVWDGSCPSRKLLSSLHQDIFPRESYIRTPSSQNIVILHKFKQYTLFKTTAKRRRKRNFEKNFKKVLTKAKESGIIPRLRKSGEKPVESAADDHWKLNNKRWVQSKVLRDQNRVWNKSRNSWREYYSNKK